VWYTLLVVAKGTDLGEHALMAITGTANNKVYMFFFMLKMNLDVPDLKIYPDD
jgi:hypothetical protein